MSIQKVNSCGTSKAVIIPKEFLQYWERQGKSFSEVLLTISDDMMQIIVKPLFENKIEATK